MKAVKKILAYVVLSIVVLLLVLVLGFNIFGEGMIRSGVESAASKTLGVPVTIRKVHLSILKGKVGIDGLVIKNPPGYANDTLLELGRGSVDVNIGSLMSNTVDIREIKLEGTKLTMEQKGLTNNLQEILDRLPKAEQAQAAEQKGKSLRIGRLNIAGTNVKVKLLPLPGKSDTVSMNIDPIVMENLGSDNKLSIGVLTAKILGALAMGVAKQGVGLLPDSMVSGIGSALGKTAELGKAATQGGKQILNTTTDAGKGAVSGIKGLFGGKKTDPNK